MENTKHRPLGAFEQVCSLFDKIYAVDFALVAEIDGQTSESSWRLAMDQVQLRHPNMRVYITVDGSGGQHFLPVQGMKVPIKTVHSQAGLGWEKVLEEEREQPFQIGSPLIRMVLIAAEKGTTVMLLAHHAIGDGTSLGFVLRDLLEEISGLKRKPLHQPISIDARLGMEPGSDPFFSSGRPGQEIQKDKRIRGTVSSHKLTQALTEGLISRSKLEGTTVHGALCASVVIAARKLMKEWRYRPVQLISPISVRRMLDVDDDFFLCISIHPVLFPADDDIPFWELARFAKEGLAGTDLACHLAEFTHSLQKIVYGQESYEGRTEILRKAFGHDLMVSNLGNIKFGTDFGCLKIKDIWGPVILSRPGHAQTVGAITCNGSLHLTNISERPMSSLLMVVEQILQQFCAQSTG